MKIFYFLFMILLFSNCSDVQPKDSFGKIDDEFLLFSDFYKWIPKYVVDAFPDSLRREKMELYFNYRLVYKEVIDSELDRKSKLLKKTADFEKEKLAQLITQTEVFEKIISKENLRKLYDELKVKRKIRSILIRFSKNEEKKVRSKAKAQELINAIYEKSRSMSFAELALQYSEDFTAGKKKGAPGWVSKYSFNPVMDSVIWSLEVGHVSKPFLGPMGFRILKVEKQVITDLKPFETELPNLKDLAINIWDYKFQDALDKYLSKLKRDAEFFISEDEIQKFCNNYEILSNDKNLNPIKTIEEMKHSFNFGSYDDINIDTQWLLNNLPGKRQHHIYANPKLVKTLIERNVEMNLLYKQALKLGLNNSNEYINQLNEYKLNTYYNYYMSEFAYKKAEANEDELKKYYEENKHNKYMTEKKIRAHILEFSTKELADNIYIKVKAGEDFDTFISTYGADISDNPKGHLGAFSKDEFGSLSRTAFELEIQASSDPIKFRNKYYLVKVVEELQPVPKFFNEVKNEIKTKLASEKKSYLEKDQIKKLKNKYNAYIFNGF